MAAFEINPCNLIRLCESIQLNNDFYSGASVETTSATKQQQSITIYQRGLSNENGVPLQVIVPKNPGQAYMKRMNESSSSVAETVGNNNNNSTGGMLSTHHAFTTTVTLDEFAVQHGWIVRGKADGTGSSNSQNRMKVPQKLIRSGFHVAILKLDVEGKEPLIIEGAQHLLKSGLVTNILTEFRRLGRPPVQRAIQTLLESGYTLVLDDDDAGTANAATPKQRKLTQHQARKYIDDLTKQLRGKMTNVDLWFQKI